jgi:type I restriction enzyme S subunit
MKLADLRNPARSTWLSDQGFRLDASPYLFGAYEARKLLERLPGTQTLRERAGTGT